MEIEATILFASGVALVAVGAATYFAARNVALREELAAADQECKDWDAANQELQRDLNQLAAEMTAWEQTALELKRDLAELRRDRRPWEQGADDGD